MSKRRVKVGSVIKRTFKWNIYYPNVHRAFKCLWAIDDPDHEFWYLSEADISDPFYAKGSKELIYSGYMLDDPRKFITYSAIPMYSSVMFTFLSRSDTWV